MKHLIRTTPDLNDIRNSGYSAARSGMKSSTNPYSQDYPVEAHEWLEGWVEFNDEFSNN